MRSPQVAYIRTLRFYERRSAEYKAGVAPARLAVAPTTPPRVTRTNPVAAAPIMPTTLFSVWGLAIPVPPPAVLPQLAFPPLPVTPIAGDAYIYIYIKTPTFWDGWNVLFAKGGREVGSSFFVFCIVLINSGCFRILF